MMPSTFLFVSIFAVMEAGLAAFMAIPCLIIYFVATRTSKKFQTEPPPCIVYNGQNGLQHTLRHVDSVALA
jgi:hypothetical protein